MTELYSMFDLSHPDSLDLLRRQTSVLELIARGGSLHTVLTAVTESLEQMIPGSHCSVLLLDRHSGTLHHGAAPTLPAQYSAAIDGMAIGAQAGSCGAAAHLDAEVVAEDIAHDQRWAGFRDFALPHGLRSCWSSPIHGRTLGMDGDDTGVLGTFAVYHGARHLPTARERRLVGHFTHLASVAIEHGRLYGALAESEERFRRAFEDNAVGMALIELDGRFSKVNAALLELLGRTEPELLATDLISLLPEEDRAVGAAALRRLIERDGSGQFEASLTRPRADPVWTALTASVVRAAEGTPLYLSVNVLDVTARHAAERDRQARRDAELAAEIAERASKAKSQFLSSLSHELRTPLQAITGFTELLGTLELSTPRRKAALGHIDSAAEHILSLVDDVLDIAKIEAGALPLKPAEVELGGLTGEVLDLLEPLAAERGIELRGPEVTGIVHADRRRLRQVLINLIGNGVRYNHHGGWVKVSVHNGQSDDMLVLRVGDSGTGISADRIDRLFVAFDRLDVDGEVEPGAGLGMVLARGLTEAMRGRLSVRSTPGEGTTIDVELVAAR